MIKTLEEAISKKCLIEIFGVGYVGFPLAVRLATSGFKVVGIDNDENKIKRLQSNSLTDYELYLKDEFFECRKRSFQLSDSPTKSNSSKVGIICVPTPIQSKNGDSNLFVRATVEKFLNFCNMGDVIIIESSIKIGTTEQMRNMIESKGFKVGKDVGLCYCPERIDPMNKDWTLENIPRVIYASDDVSFNVAQSVYHYVNNSHLIRVNSSKVAELVKSYENSFRLVNISLVNELAVLCDRLGVDVNDVITAASTKPFGFMAFYPSGGAGGHCIPKDPTFLSETAKASGTQFSTIDTALKINSLMPIHIVSSIEKVITKLGLEKSALVCGLAYKPDIEDMRDSPGFRIVEELKQKNFKVAAYDPYYKKELHKRYLQENNLSELEFNALTSLDDSQLANFNCICIVQHHAVIKSRLSAIYQRSLVPFIYDCQHKLIKNQKSKTILNFYDYDIKENL
ncbi:MAG: nucleotide sugar dehydrogenase [Thaumarchaeota archaeon]|nr:nucleotide sugar dehydrogenase [Nitrososphaerota archaeon]